MTWTRFFDMYSGGSRKLEHDCIWIELPKADAIKEFERRFGIDPLNITCDCCGKDYGIFEYKQIDEQLKADSGYCKNILAIRFGETYKAYLP